jgi:hypothetical protein
LPSLSAVHPEPSARRVLLDLKVLPDLRVKKATPEIQDQLVLKGQKARKAYKEYKAPVAIPVLLVLRDHKET